MSQWPHDDTASKIKFFGKPGENLITITPPFQMYYDKHPIKTLLINKMVATSLLKIFTEILDKCGHDQAKIDQLGVSNYGGCFNNRSIRGSKNISNHAFGAAIDIDPDNYPLGSSKRQPDIIINAFKNEGWLYGGDYSGRKDPMHYEAVSR